MNAGWPVAYALEAGRRVHLWPAPDRAVTLVVRYQRPIDIAIVPDEWEPVILDGLAGLYGRHWDRDALTGRADAFERRWLGSVQRLNRDSRDVRVSDRRADGAMTTVTAASGSETPTGLVVPASLTGIGAVTIDTGEYPLEVA